MIIASVGFFKFVTVSKGSVQGWRGQFHSVVSIMPRFACCLANDGGNKSALRRETMSSIKGRWLSCLGMEKMQPYFITKKRDCVWKAKA
jgi:hypothetical protein